LNGVSFLVDIEIHVRSLTPYDPTTCFADRDPQCCHANDLVSGHRSGQAMLPLKSTSRNRAVLHVCGLSLSDYTAHLASAASLSASLPTRKSPMISRHHRLARGAADAGRNWPPMNETLPLFTLPATMLCQFSLARTSPRHALHGDAYHIMKRQSHPSGKEKSILRLLLSRSLFCPEVRTPVDGNA